MNITASTVFNIEFFISEIIIAGVIFYFVEKLKPAQKNVPFFKKEFKNELLLALLNVGIFTPLLTISVVTLLTTILDIYLPYQLFATQIESLPLYLQIIIGMIVMDFAVYWRHRFTHFYMWSYHSIHHSVKEITWLTSMRLHPIDILAALVFDTVIMHLVGFNGAGILGALIILKIMNYVTHINMDLQFGKPLRYVLASPNFHRWHHASVREAYDKNFCSTFSFLDLLFGTYYHPETLPPDYGLSKTEQKNFPDSLSGWLLYPFKRDWKQVKKYLRIK